MSTDVYSRARAIATRLAEINGEGKVQTVNQLLKVAEEVGEVSAAWSGVLGINPRKGVTHTYRDVAEELGDVALAAMVAILMLGYEPEEILTLCAGKAGARLWGYQMIPRPNQWYPVDHPHTDPGDGREECETCGKWVWPVIHSCKGVPVTGRARARREEGSDDLGEGGD